jgi:hypothetical protein
MVAGEEDSAHQSIEPKLGRSGCRRLAGQIVSRDLIRFLPVRSAFGLAVYVTASPAAPFSTPKAFGARNDKNARLEWKRMLRPQEPNERSNPDLHA